MNIGDIMSEGLNRALKSLAIFAGLLVYGGMIVYSGVHNWRLMTAGLDPDMIVWAAIGVVALEISALALPVALHWWTHAPLQRICAFAFYAIDLLLVFSNVVLDYAIVSGQSAIPEWLDMYLFYIVPATPIVAGLGWSLIFMLDPSQQERAVNERLKAATREALANRILGQAKSSAQIAASVERSAETITNDIVNGVLGISVGKTTPKGIVNAAFKMPENGDNHVYADDTATMPEIASTGKSDNNRAGPKN